MTHIRIVLRWALTILIAATFLPAFTGCGKKGGEIKANHITWESLIRDLIDLENLPVLDDADVRLYSSHDRSGGNNDFNYFERRSKDAGWIVLADLEGPGCVRRFWMTGTDPGHRIRIYIDNAREPVIDEEIDRIFGSADPWTPPIAQYINLCYYSYLPIPFNEAIRIETMEPNTHPFWGPRRIFFQLGVEHFDEATTSFESYPAQASAAQSKALEDVRSKWNGYINSRAINLDGATQTAIQPGQRQTVFSREGSGTLREWSLDINPQNPGDLTAMEREYLLQDTVLRVYYDGKTFPSIETPVGDFFANGWRKRNLGALWMTSGDDGYACRLPLPYKSGIRIEIENGSDHAIDIAFAAEESATREENAGYLHAEYRRSGPGGGQPHTVSAISGRGKFLGCYLGVTGLDESWWILEGDESMWVDGSARPVWQGTGLEDYFNGGWYYRGATFGALNGNLDRSPFRVGQYRHQHPDPVSFQQSFQIDFERMLSEQSGLPVNGYFQSVGYSYREQPGSVPAVSASRDDRRAVTNPFDQRTFLLQLVELERMNDFSSAIRYIDEFIERFPESEEIGVYRLRQVEYRRLLGETIGPDDYAPFLNGEHGQEANRQAQILEWFYADPKRALIGMNVNGQGRMILNGKTLMSGDHPFNLFVMGAELPPGEHRMAAQVEFARGEPWIQIGVRMQDGVAGTGPGSLSSRSVQPNWATTDVSGPSWHSIDLRDIPRGVPDAPYLGGIANAFVLIQSKSYPIRGLDWGYHRGTMYYRENFTVPINGWPSLSEKMTGLEK